MRFTALLLTSALAVLVSAETTSDSSSTSSTTLSTSTTTTATSEAPASTSQSPEQICIDACTPGDVNCIAKCIAVPNPDAAAANATNNCVAACPQGNGTAADNLKYKDCVEACIGKFYFTSGGTTATATGTSQPTGSGSGSGSVVTTTDSNGSTVTSTASPTKSSGSGSGTGTGTSASGSAASPTTSTAKSSAGEMVRVGSAVGLVGVVVCMLGL